MSGRRPDFRVVAKSKQAGEYVDLFAFWLSDDGRWYRGKMGERVKHIVLDDGRVVTGEHCWFNLQANRDEQDEPTQEPDTGNVPF